MNTNALVSQLATILAWTHEPQPALATISHFGPTSSTVLPGWRVQLTPCIADGRPAFYFQKDGSGLAPGGQRYENPVTQAEIDTLLLAVAQVQPVAHSWPNPGFPWVSFALDYRIGDGLRQLLATYRKGCALHPGKSVFCACDAWRAQFAACRFPEGWR